MGGFAYYFQKNLQGDVIAITNSYGNVVARYTYDAWGVCTVVSDETGIIARANPYRYRGYYYDSEIGLYYLQSRYYDPTVGRFVNADTIIMQNSIVGCNLFTYCQNNVLNNYDIYGYVSASTTCFTNNRIKFTIKLTDKDIRTIKFGITGFAIIFDALCAIIGIVGGIPSLGISVICATIAGIVVSAVCGLTLAYIEFKDYGKGAYIDVYVKYGFYTFYYSYLKISRRGISIAWGRRLVPYAYPYRIPKITWNK